MLGWLLQVPGMVSIVHGLVPMVFNTGLGFALAGLALMLGDHARGVPRTLIGWFLLILCSMTLVEHMRDASLGIDMAWVHHWLDYGNTRPGRMAPNTALGFMLFGAVNIVLRRVDTRAKAYFVVVLTFCVLTIGLTGLIGYLLAPDLLFGWSRSARMAIHTACGMIAAAIGLWASWFAAGWFAGPAYFTEAAKVRVLGTAILIVVTTTVGLTGFVLMQESLERAIEGRLRSVVQGRAPWLATITGEIVQHAKTELRMVGAVDAALPMLLGRPLGSHEGTFDDVARRLLAEGYPHVAVEDAARRVVNEMGEFEAPARFAAPLDNDGTELVWNGIQMLRVRVPVMQDGRLIGYVRLDRSLEAFNRSLFDVATLGRSAELSACIRQRDELVCLPNSRNENVFHIDLRAGRGKQKLPMEYALEGKTGVVYAHDYRRNNVVAAYGPIFPGLGLVAKQDTVEAYSVIRGALEFGAPVIVLISIAGAFALYSQMDPLVTRMHESEARAERAATEIRTLMSAVGEGIITIDGRGRIREANPAASSIFGYEGNELVGQDVATLIPPESRAAHESGLARAAAGGPPRLIGTPNVKVEGLRKDGTRFALELTITAASVGSERQFVGIMRDITERLALEQKLERMAQYDSLTGLANRSLFNDRLRIALARSHRNRCALALMFIDLDGFKRVNDTMGHHAGDELLVAVAGRMTAAVRSTDTVARLGGDEFTVILEDMKQPAHEAAGAVAGKIVGEMQAPFEIGGRTTRIGASVGLVVLEADDPKDDIEAIIQLADQRMYQAKLGGKNRVVAL
ncbi:diguanylate cyclase domain-containing protein [Pseudoduganella umbonata]|uniref:Diguanylate cyclase n=1 Tax=Pseudoduganella umbonata TaxID=864828 RepID=A0A4P8HTM5_9BURK|nr:diguanylate cyclase [Pseudoduganella umbonata]MBB3220622.1 diguanylate cyclase (GGDEF)-like protein/PAS domain S-box-containing protein [Pseudoduganella umbonata]QCP11880.1 diguanylate cyclase [Pseudoduganella umbonata]